MYNNTFWWKKGPYLEVCVHSCYGSIFCWCNAQIFLFIIQEHGEEEGDNLIKPLFQQNLPPNGKVMLLADVGKCSVAFSISFTETFRV